MASAVHKGENTFFDLIYFIGFERADTAVFATPGCNVSHRPTRTHGAAIIPYSYFFPFSSRLMYLGFGFRRRYICIRRALPRWRTEGQKEQKDDTHVR